MKKQFLNPEMDIVWLRKLDVLATSSDPDTQLPGGNEEVYGPDVDEPDDT